MKTLILTVAMLMGAGAFADGFVCQNLDENLRLKVYDQTQPTEGTRNAAIMIVSDPSISDGNMTTATFSADDSLLTNTGPSYTAEVDLRYATSGAAGRNIGGTKLGDVKYITLDVDYNFANPVPNGTAVEGEVTLTRRNGGDDIHISIDCIRYLKGS